MHFAIVLEKLHINEITHVAANTSSPAIWLCDTENKQNGILVTITGGTAHE